MENIPEIAIEKGKENVNEMPITNTIEVQEIVETGTGRQKTESLGKITEVAAIKYKIVAEAVSVDKTTTDPGLF